jgi:hypothetical protein
VNVTPRELDCDPFASFFSICLVTATCQAGSVVT